MFSEVSLTDGRDKVVKFPVSSDSQKTETDKDKAIQPHPPSEPALMGGEGRVTDEKPEEITEQDPLEIAKREAAENRDRWVRAVADLENYKKRAIQERSAILKYKNEDLLRDLLTVTDNIQTGSGFLQQRRQIGPGGRRHMYDFRYASRSFEEIRRNGN